MNTPPNEPSLTDQPTDTLQSQGPEPQPEHTLSHNPPTEVGGTSHKSVRIPNSLMHKMMEEAAINNISFNDVMVNRMVSCDLLRTENERLKTELDTLRQERRDSYELMQRASGKESRRIAELEEKIEKLEEDLEKAEILSEAKSEALAAANAEMEKLKTFFEATTADPEPALPVPVASKSTIEDAEAYIERLKAERKALRTALLHSSPYTESDVDILLDETKRQWEENRAHAA